MCGHNFEGHVDGGEAGSAGEAHGVVEQRLGRADLDRRIASISLVKGRRSLSSPPGLTRWSMLTCGRMDCRIKSGNDDAKLRWLAALWFLNR